MFWLKALREGAAQLNSVAGWVGFIILLVGVAVGFAVPVVYHHLSHWFTAVVLLGLLVVVVAQGSYSVWLDAEKERKDAEEARDEARGVIADRRRDQAKFIEVRRTIGTPDFSFGQAAGVQIRVKNRSELLIRDVVIFWRKGTNPWGEPDHLSDIGPRDEKTRHRDFPANVLPADEKLFSADVYFRDTNQVTWHATPDGNLEEAPPS